MAQNCFVSLLCIVLIVARCFVRW